MTDKPQQVIDAMDTSAYFDVMATTDGRRGAATPEDAPIMARMAKIGLDPGRAIRHNQARSGRAGSAQEYSQGCHGEDHRPESELGSCANGWRIPARPGATGPTILVAL